MIRLDKTQHSIVVVCSECPSWRAVRLDKAQAVDAGRVHVAVEHAGDVAAGSAARQQAYRARKAAAR